MSDVMGRHTGRMRVETDDVLDIAYANVAHAMGRMLLEGRSTNFKGIDALDNARKYIVQAKVELQEIRAQEDSR